MCLCSDENRPKNRYGHPFLQTRLASWVGVIHVYTLKIFHIFGIVTRVSPFHIMLTPSFNTFSALIIQTYQQVKVCEQVNLKKKTSN
jgi:hypothetical protein